MPKPNRYDGNGKVHPNGTVCGRYIMRNGHWVDIQSPLGRHTRPLAEARKGLAKAIWAGVGIATAIAVSAVLFLSK